jgi:T5SS/PEP-CTERM-associated repeat protein
VSLPVANACALTLGPDAGTSGNVTVSNSGALQVTTSVVVGNHGTGSLSVTNGTVTGGNMYVGGTASTDGTGLLTVTDSSTVTATSVLVYPTGTLTGNGTVSASSGTTIQGTIVPSGTAPSNDTLTISSGDLTFCSSSGCSPLMESKVVPAGADNVNVSNGAASLSGKLSVSMSGTFTPGTTYTLLHAANGLRNTQFSSVSITYPTCQCFKPEIQYATNGEDVNLYLRPEPCCTQ